MVVTARLYSCGVWEECSILKEHISSMKMEAVFSSETSGSEKCLNQVLLCFHFSRSPEDCTKRWGMLALVNQLFKVYFRINKLHLCKPLIRAIDSSPFKDHFTLGQRVTYRFYVGRKAMFDSDYKAGKFSARILLAS
jgi:hypothetical protein